jgi:hypothetical protein
MKNLKSLQQARPGMPAQQVPQQKKASPHQSMLEH